MICKLCQGIIQSELAQRSRAATFPSTTDTRTVTRASPHTSRASKHERTGIHVVWEAGNHDNCYCPGSHVRPVECATTRSYPGPSASRRTFVRCLRKGSLSIKKVKAQGDRGCRGSAMETLLTKKESQVRGSCSSLRFPRKTYKLCVCTMPQQEVDMSCARETGAGEQ